MEYIKHTVFTEYLQEEEKLNEESESNVYFNVSYFKASRKVDDYCSSFVIFKSMIVRNLYCLDE